MALMVPVKERVRVSVRVPSTVAAMLDDEVARRRALKRPGGSSRAELVTVAVFGLMGEVAERGEGWLHRQFRAALAFTDVRACDKHLQDRINPGAVDWIDAAVMVLSGRFRERRASRHALIVTAVIRELGLDPLSQQ